MMIETGQAEPKTNNGKSDALYFQIQSNKCLLSENSYLLKKCAETQTKLNRSDAEIYRLNNETKAINKWSDEMRNNLTAKDTTIERLTEDISNVIDICNEHIPDKLRGKYTNTTPYGRVKWCLEDLQERITHFQSLDESSEATIKEREAEAKSYRDCYNDLKRAVAGKDMQESFVRSMTQSDIVHKAKYLWDIINTYQQKVEKKNTDTREYREHWRLKYDRLVALLKKKWKFMQWTNSILEEHRANEKKLAKKKEGK